MLNWKDFPRTKDKVAIVGFHEATREHAPYDNPDYEIWSCNEEYEFPWLKRTDRHFQLHPRWDFSRTNNNNHPNHLLWLQNREGTCIRCKGESVIQADKTFVPCPHCKDGVYVPPETRNNILVYMQRAWDDIPNSIPYPMNDVTKEFLPASHYYTSSPAFMLSLAMLMDFKEIELYGFDMGTMTEYHYQRANFEYWIGIAHGRGIKVTLPGSKILTGLLYGYENMRTGYRQNLEMRKFSLDQQFNSLKTKCIKLEAKLELLKELKEKGITELEEVYKEKKMKLAHNEGMLNFLNGCRTETDNLTKMYDGYFTVGTEDENSDVQAYVDNEQHINAKYIDKDGSDGEE